MVHAAGSPRHPRLAALAGAAAVLGAVALTLLTAHPVRMTGEDLLLEPGAPPSHRAPRLGPTAAVHAAADAALASAYYLTLDVRLRAGGETQVWWGTGQADFPRQLAEVALGRAGGEQLERVVWAGDTHYRVAAPGYQEVGGAGGPGAGGGAPRSLWHPAGYVRLARLLRFQEAGRGPLVAGMATRYRGAADLAQLTPEEPAAQALRAGLEEVGVRQVTVDAWVSRSGRLSALRLQGTAPAVTLTVWCGLGAPAGRVDIRVPGAAGDAAS